MARQSKRTPQKINRLRQMRADGVSIRVIATELGVNHQTIANWVRDLGLEQKLSKATPRSSKAKSTSKVESATSNTTSKTKTKTKSKKKPTKPAPDLLSLDPLEGSLETVRARLRTVTEMLARVTPLAEDGSYSANQFGQLVKLETELASRLAAMAPPAPVDPEQDPNRKERADEALAKLSILVSQAELAERLGI